MIAALQIDNGKDGRGYLDIALRPDLRGRRLGVAVLSAFISGPGSEFKVLEGAIEPDNAASLACVRRCGFQIFLGLDEDGLVRVERYREDVDPQGREPTCVP
ncbi:MAG: acetyltransferase family protein [Devosia sp.]|nr:acetyltransferase family protein [Devosia sp.]